MQGSWDPMLRWLGCWSRGQRRAAWTINLVAMALLVAVLVATMVVDVRELEEPWSPVWTAIILIVILWQTCILQLLRWAPNLRRGSRRLLECQVPSSSASTARCSASALTPDP